MEDEIVVVIKKILLNKYIKYFALNDENELKILNSDLGKFRKHLYHQSVTIDETYRKVLQERFSHGTKLGKTIYMKYVKDDSIASLDYLDVPCYNSLEKKIYLNANMDLINPRGAGVTWFHEHGHYIDAVLGCISDDDIFSNLLYVDAVKYRQNYGRKYHLESLELVDISICKELNDMHLHSAISDMMEGITKGKIINISGHGNDYWLNDITNMTSEAFAHMFECQFDNDRRKEMKEYFPKSLNYFEKELKRLRGR